MVVVGIGIVLVSELLCVVGVEGGNGVVVDEYGCMLLMDIFVIGDCVLYVNSYVDGMFICFEFVQNVNDFVVMVVCEIMGDLEFYNCVLWFWLN